jgi:death on curing protein
MLLLRQPSEGAGNDPGSEVAQSGRLHSRESALARPRQRFSYDPEVDLAALAAAYGYGLALSHPYNDGNRRVAFMVMAVFIDMNDCQLVASETDVVTTIVALASGELNEETLEDWIRRHIAKGRQHTTH